MIDTYTPDAGRQRGRAVVFTTLLVLGLVGWMGTINISLPKPDRAVIAKVSVSQDHLIFVKPLQPPTPEVPVPHPPKPGRDAGQLRHIQVPHESLSEAQLRDPDIQSPPAPHPSANEDPDHQPPIKQASPREVKEDLHVSVESRVVSGAPPSETGQTSGPVKADRPSTSDGDSGNNKIGDVTGGGEVTGRNPSTEGDSPTKSGAGTGQTGQGGHGTLPYDRIAGWIRGNGAQLPEAVSRNLTERSMDKRFSAHDSVRTSDGQMYDLFIACLGCNVGVGAPKYELRIMLVNRRDNQVVVQTDLRYSGDKRPSYKSKGTAVRNGSHIVQILTQTTTDVSAQQKEAFDKVFNKWLHSHKLEAR